MKDWEKRLAKRRWALAHPDKVKQSNKNYRRWNRSKLNAQAAARMARYRQRLSVTGRSRTQSSRNDQRAGSRSAHIIA